MTTIRPTLRTSALTAAALLIAGLATVPLLDHSAAAVTPAGSPVGTVERVAGIPGGLAFRGWAYDPNTATPIGVYLTVDGKKSSVTGARTVADVARPDLAHSRPQAVGHGFATSVLLPAGRHVICVWAANAAGTPGVAQPIQCRTRTLNYSPDGQVQSLKTEPGHVHVSGWAFDSDIPTKPVSVRITVAGTSTTVVASRVNDTARRVHPYGGANHGFSATLPMAQGTHQVCVTALNVGYGRNTTLRCSSVTLAESPVGSLDSAAQSAGKLRVRGWDFDPDAPTTPLTTIITVDGTAHPVTANGARSDVAADYPKAGAAHGFDESYTLPEGTHRVCVTAVNVSYGSNVVLGCQNVVLNFTPTATITAVTQTATGLAVTGWASDPDTSKPIHVDLTVDNTAEPTGYANQSGSAHSGHVFAASYPMTSGKHTVCAVALNVFYGTHNSPKVCRSLTLALSPVGSYDSAVRNSSQALVVTGWAFDPDTTRPIQVAATLDGAPAGTYTADVSRPDVFRQYPSSGSAAHGFSITATGDQGEHTVCLVAKNVGGGSDTNLGCKTVNAVHPVTPAAPQAVTANAGYGGATVNWQAPASDGGAPWSSYTVSTTGHSVTVGPSTTSATITGLSPATTYTFTVTAKNVAGQSAGGVSPAVTTQASPPAQTSPAPVSTSRYIRNVTAATATDLATMRREGAADAGTNPSGHGYLVLLDIGGQDQSDGGVVLSATTHFVAYGDLVKDIDAYLDGYASAQHSSAPVTIAIGTNNDMDVSTTSGRAWADQVIDPIRSYAGRYSGVTIAGANDVEPGFRATYSQTRAWLAGYLGATTAPFVFNGSADGCSWTSANSSCNNGWSMSGLYTLSEGAAPVRSIDLPQVYNTVMAGQWKYISLTGVQNGQPRINFGGPLTEWTACSQAGGCGSLTGRNAWAAMWQNLQSDSRLAVASLPYSTDLRIDR